MPKFNTQPISDAHDKIFDKAVEGLEKLREQLVELTGKLADRTESTPVLKELSVSETSINDAFANITKALTKQHDFVEKQLAKVREDETVSV